MARKIAQHAIDKSPRRSQEIQRNIKYKEILQEIQREQNGVQKLETLFHDYWLKIPSRAQVLSN